MTWRDNLKPASFRGAKFFTDSHDYEFGRKNIFHDFPFRDDAEVEDQGALADGFSITGYVLGNKDNNQNYFIDRDALIKALKEKGSGQLVHRYLGNKSVALNGSARMTETTREGNIARFQMTFKEVKQEKPFTIIADPVASMDAVAEDAGDVNVDVFTALMDTAADLNKLSTDINAGSQSTIAKLRQLKGLPGSVISSATSIVLSRLALVSAVLSTPCDLANAVTGGFDSFLFAAGMLDDTVSGGVLGNCSGRVQNPDDDDNALNQIVGIALVTASANLSTFGADLPAITVASPASAADQANRQANINLTRLQALITACRIAVRTVYTSQDAANDLLLLITGLIDDYLDYLGAEAGDDTLANYNISFSNDEIYQSVKGLKAGLKKSMDIIGAELAQIVEYDVGPEVLSTLTLAYDRYEDLDRDQELIDRNPLLILNPCFIPGGKTINILSE